MTTLRTVVSKVAKRLSSAKIANLLNTFIKVDLPTLIYPNNAKHTTYHDASFAWSFIG